MCGLFGVISTTLNEEEIDAFKDLGVVSTLRGYWGSGLAGVPVNKKYHVEMLRHESATASDLVHMDEFDKLWKDHAFSIFMGHARQPTKGGNTLDDTHPHRCKHIVGMHNGTLTAVGDKQVNDANDSSMLFKSIADKGLEDTIRDVKGSYALSYLDTDKEELVFLRNEDRPLYFGHLKNINTIFWASEANFLHLVLNRCFKSRGVLDIYRLPENTKTVFDFRPSGKLWPKSMHEVKQEEKEAVKTNHPLPVVTQPTSPTTNGAGGGGNDERTDTLWETLPRRYLTFADLKKVLANGCVYCEETGLFKDYAQKKMVWTDHREFICEACALDDRFAQDYIQSKGILLPRSIQ